MINLIVFKRVFDFLLKIKLDGKDVFCTLPVELYDNLFFCILAIAPYTLRFTQPSLQANSQMTIPAVTETLSECLVPN